LAGSRFVALGGRPLAEGRDGLDEMALHRRVESCLAAGHPVQGLPYLV
jgi:hypothetical protein